MAVFDSLSKGVVSRRWGSLVAAGLLSFTLYGCGGSDSDSAPPPPPPPPPVESDVAAVIAAAAANPANDSSTNMASAFSGLNGTGLAKVTINNAPVVNFTVFSDGAVKKGLTSATLFLSKLVPGTNGSPDKWVNYIWSDDAGTWGMVDGVWVGDNFVGTPVITDAAKARTAGADSGGALVENAAGYYTYTFGTDITDATLASAKDSSGSAVVYEPGRTHRLSLQLDYNNAAGERVRVNPYYDFTVGADGKSIDAANPKQVADIRSCNSCHEKLELHGGSRNDVTICIQCHQPGSIDKGTGETIDMMHLVHKIHAAHDLTEPYYFYRFRGIERFYDFSPIGFPQDVRNCTKCHTGDTSTDPLVAVQTAQGNNWFNKPNRAACGSCHDGIDFATSTGTTLSGEPNIHTSGAFSLSDDSSCTLCHGADNGLAVKLVHVTGDSTPNNLTVPVGAANFDYEIASATVNSATATIDPNATVIKFRIKKDGVNLDVSAGPPAGFTEGPSFLFAWAMEQDGVVSPADFNNLAAANGAFLNATRGDAMGRSLAQLRTAPNTLTYDPATGLNTATVKATAYQFPAGAKMRTVGLQSYYTQTSIESGRHAVSVVKTVTGETPRRSVVDNAKCANCHDRLALHGGSRVYEIQVCVMCHNPSKATSGRGITDEVWDAYAAKPTSTFTAQDFQIMKLWGMDLSLTNRALQFPVDSNNMKDMIHGMHAQKDRAFPFRDARDRTTSAITLLDFSRIAFPGVLSNCETCHKPGTYASVPANALATTNEFRNSAVDAAMVVAPLTTAAAAKASLAQLNAGDVVATPFAAACVTCHDSSLTKTHIGLNGGQVGAPVSKRNVAADSQTDTRALMNSKGGPGAETCALCHGAGKIADVTVVHK